MKLPKRELLIAAPTMNGPTLFKVSYDRQQKDYFENFVPRLLRS